MASSMMLGLIGGKLFLIVMILLVKYSEKKMQYLYVGILPPIVHSCVKLDMESFMCPMLCVCGS